MSDESPTVLVVEDEESLAQVYSDYLATSYEVKTAYNGVEALEIIDSDVEVVLLDRRMPEMTGDEFLEKIRSKGIDCRVAMVTAVDPDFDLVDMDFDAYLRKPISNEKLRETVEKLLKRKDYQKLVREYFQLVSKYTTLKSHKSPQELEENEEFKRLEKELEETNKRVEETISDLDVQDFEMMFHNF